MKRTATTSRGRIAVIGGGLGGLSAAIHLKVAGFEVTIYEAQERVGGRANQIEAQGFRFDTGPSLLNYPWVFEDLFRAAGRTMSDYVELLPVDPSIRFVWRDGTRFTLSSKLDQLLEECLRLEPGSGPALMAFLANAETKYNFSFRKLVSRNEDNPFKWLGALSPSEMALSAVWRSLDSELARYFKSRHIREALGSYAMYLGGSPWNLPGLFSILPFGELAYGLWLPKGGIYGLVQGIERLAVELGVRIVTQTRVDRITSDRGRVTGLVLDGGRAEPWDIVVSNVDVPTTQTHLFAKPRRPRRPRMTPGVITYYWGLRGKVKGLGHHTIFLPDDVRATFDDLLKRKRLPADPAFYISVASETDRALAPAGDTALFMLAPTPLISELDDRDWATAAEVMKARILSRLREHDIEIGRQQFVVEQVYTPMDWRSRFGLYDGSAFGAAHTLLQLGPMRDRNFDPEIQGLYYTGAGTTPGTGMPMVLLGGKMTAERILSHAC
jgi:phytoene desaturase